MKISGITSHPHTSINRSDHPGISEGKRTVKESEVKTMTLLKDIYKLGRKANQERNELIDSNPNYKDTDEYKVLTAKIKAYSEVYDIVEKQLRELKDIVSEMASFM